MNLVLLDGAHRCEAVDLVEEDDGGFVQFRLHASMSTSSVRQEVAEDRYAHYLLEE